MICQPPILRVIESHQRRHALPVVFALALLWVSGGHWCSAQTDLVQLRSGESMPSFEVAAIRPNHSGRGREQIWHNDNSWRVENLSLRDLIQNAWGISSSARVIGRQDPILSDRFDIKAKISDQDTRRLSELPRIESNRQVSLMLQNLLTDRFNLKTHVETRELPVFVLLPAKGGMKFRSSVPVPSGKPGVPAEPHTSFTAHISSSGADAVLTNRTMATLVGFLGRQPELGDRPLLDKTNMSGTYDFTLHWLPDRLNAGLRPVDSNNADPAPGGPSLFTALQDQLGLKIVPEKAPIQVLVIDHVEPPTAN